MSIGNKGELILHIGPPKTGTTSLQYFFQKLDNNQIEYHGIEQPRSSKDLTIAKRIYQAVIKGDNSEKRCIIEDLKRKIESGISVILSEELFLVNSGQISWEEKISRLYKYLMELNPKFLIVIRNPVKAIPSFYQEIYYSIDKIEINNINDFAKSNHCKIFMYEHLLNEIRRIGGADIILLEFEKLIKQEYTLSQVFNNKQNGIIEVGIENKSQVVNGDRFAKNASLGKIILHNLLFLKKMPFLKKMNGRGIGSGLLKLIPDIKIYRTHKIDENLSPDVLKHFLSEYNTTLNKLGNQER